MRSEISSNIKILTPCSIDSDLADIKKPELKIAGTFGPTFRQNFLLNDRYLILNHGSFGTTPKYVEEYVEYYSRCSEYNIDKWMDQTIRPMIYNSLERIAPYVGVQDPLQLAYVQNSTTAVSTALRGLSFEAGDVIFKFSTTYNACSNAVKYICDTTKAEFFDITLNFPMTNEEIINATRDAINKVKQDSSKRVRFALIDAIISVPGIVLPYQEISAEFKKESALVFIDAAHALGMIELNIDSLGCDYFVTNAHKWFYSKRGCAIFYVANKNKTSTQPLVISHSYKPECEFGESFLWQGTIDFSTYLSSNAAIDFIEAVGGLKTIQSYCRDLVHQATELYQNKYNFIPLTNEKSQTANFVNMIIPTLEYGNPKHDKIGYELKDTILTRHNASGVVYPHNGHWNIRLSAQIFIDLDDFDKYAKILVETIEKELS
ncbi:putative L-cysteine desulfhydrase 1 [Smittium culicis]|uniref:Putative L-cysteine desulfhydrase 1 n=1 Tax=Smittium culicis TaxID=133412 RepID=A0A1R1YKY4_9FUNG|nr:putative L-cysteine desulfhydrase 1 [Smittium culicis]